MQLRALPLGFVLAVGVAAAAAPPTEEKIPLYEGLGLYHRAITTTSTKAQGYFDQGMMLGYAFGRPEAVKSFRAAQEEDAACAICAWGEAWALGPYINEEMEEDAAAEAFAAIRKAQDRQTSATDAERGLIAAMARRYAEDPAKAKRDALDLDYTAAMRDLWKQYPEDDDIASLFAEALMVLHPWDLYPGGTPRPEVTEAVAVLETVLARDLRDPGACHLYIHAVEASAAPGRAEACADLLSEGIPLGSHIQHMPSHIYMRIGRYADAVRANQHAHMVDDMAKAGKAVAIYPGHNLHMLWYAAWMDGQSAVALQAALDLGAQDGAVSQEYLLGLARFGRWDELIALRKGPRVPFDEGIWSFARGLAFLRSGDVKKARKALARLDRLAAVADPEKTFSPRSKDGPIDILRIAQGILAGEMAAAAGDRDAAVRHLEAAVVAEDAFEYSEPERWPIPARQVLGGVLLEIERPADAKRIYEEDLVDHPENGWSLFGLAESLKALGEEERAAGVEKRFTQAWARSDLRLTSSRF